jgi:DHA1 family tetracycline resistance protein-like MFS transporter
MPIWQTSPRKRIETSNFGKMSISTNLGFVVVPALAGVLSTTHYGIVATVLGAIVISLIGISLLVLYIPESKQCSFKVPANTENPRKIFGKEAKNAKLRHKRQRNLLLEKLSNFLIFLIC